MKLSQKRTLVRDILKRIEDPVEESEKPGLEEFFFYCKESFNSDRKTRVSVTGETGTGKTYAVNLFSCADDWLERKGVKGSYKTGHFPLESANGGTSLTDFVYKVKHFDYEADAKIGGFLVSFIFESTQDFKSFIETQDHSYPFAELEKIEHQIHFEYEEWKEFSEFIRTCSVKKFFKNNKALISCLKEIQISSNWDFPQDIEIMDLPTHGRNSLQDKKISRVLEESHVIIKVGHRLLGYDDYIKLNSISKFSENKILISAISDCGFDIEKREEIEKDYTEEVKNSLNRLLERRYLKTLNLSKDEEEVYASISSQIAMKSFAILLFPNERISNFCFFEHLVELQMDRRIDELFESLLRTVIWPEFESPKLHRVSRFVFSILKERLQVTNCLKFDFEAFVNKLEETSKTKDKEGEEKSRDFIIKVAENIHKERMEEEIKKIKLHYLTSFYGHRSMLDETALKFILVSTYEESLEESCLERRKMVVEFSKKALQAFETLRSNPKYNKDHLSDELSAILARQINQIFEFAFSSFKDSIMSFFPQSGLEFGFEKQEEIKEEEDFNVYDQKEELMKEMINWKPQTPEFLERYFNVPNLPELEKAKCSFIEDTPKKRKSSQLEEIFEFKSEEMNHDCKEIFFYKEGHSHEMIYNGEITREVELSKKNKKHFLVTYSYLGGFEESKELKQVPNETICFIFFKSKEESRLFQQSEVFNKKWNKVSIIYCIFEDPLFHSAMNCFQKAMELFKVEFYLEFEVEASPLEMFRLSRSKSQYCLLSKIFKTLDRFHEDFKSKYDRRNQKVSLLTIPCEVAYAEELFGMGEDSKLISWDDFSILSGRITFIVTSANVIIPDSRIYKRGFSKPENFYRDKLLEEAKNKRLENLLDSGKLVISLVKFSA